jgi:lipopolysaccharide biosynthesis regulator YciM
MLKLATFKERFFLCLILGFSLDIHLAYSQISPSAPTVPTDSSATPRPVANPLGSILSSVQPSVGKYDEYQSICRQNEVDTPAFAAAEIQQKRIDLLNEKIKQTLSANKLKLRLLKEIVDQNKAKEAEQYYVKLKEENLSEEDTKTADALFATIKNDFKKAETILSKILIDNPKNTGALKYLAEIYLLDNNYFESATAYLDLEKLTNEKYPAELCEIYTLDSQYKEAEKFCKKAIQKDNENPYPFINLGISQRERLNYTLALEYFKRSVKIKKTEMGYTCLGELYYIKEKYPTATLLFKQAAKISPNSARAKLGLAWAQLKSKNYTDSLSSFKEACSKNKNSKIEIRRAFKILNSEKSAYAKQFADLAQNCNE